MELYLFRVVIYSMYCRAVPGPRSPRARSGGPRLGDGSGSDFLADQIFLIDEKAEECLLDWDCVASLKKPWVELNRRNVSQDE
eukprot:12891564-Alexandrium_andersonii.AAC.1